MSVRDKLYEVYGDSFSSRKEFDNLMDRMNGMYGSNSEPKRARIITNKDGDYVCITCNGHHAFCYCMWCEKYDWEITKCDCKNRDADFESQFQ